MSDEIGDEETTKTEQLIASQGWASKPSGNGENVAVEVCPFCRNTNWKFFIHIGGDKDGLFRCVACEENGNYWQLKERLGISMTNVSSMRAAASPGAPQALPNLETMHRRLMTDEAMGDVLDYLVAERGFSIATITKLKLGAEEYNGKKWYVIPYLDAAGKPTYYKARSIPTVPPTKKEFRAPAGREAPLYNESCLKTGMSELVMVEGEADCIALINQGCANVVGIPGAGMKKAEWIVKLDRLAPATIFLCYDTDKVGQDAAKEMAARVGIDKCRNLVLPAFEIDGPDGTKKAGKDLNEFFASGHTLEEFEVLKVEAQQFPVAGVQTSSEVLDELMASLTESGAEPTYLTPWPSLTKRLGGCEPGDMIGIMAQGKTGKTTLALNWCQWFAERHAPSLLFCLEMLPTRMVRKWASLVTQTDDTPGASQLTPETVGLAKAIAINMQNDILFGYGQSRKPEDVCNTIEQAVRRYGVKLVVVDNLQLLLHGVKDVAQETSKVSKQIKALAMKLGVVILLIVQPKRVQEGTIIGAYDAIGSSAVEKDVDAMVLMHRNECGRIQKATDFHGMLETDEGLEPQILMRVPLSRYSAGGACTLWMEGGTSTVRELNSDESSSAGAVVRSGVISIEAEAI
jgi:KaiC/GvpD/RAD55 family RecA-like ATPase